MEVECSFKLRAEREKELEYRKVGPGQGLSGPHPGPVSTRCVTIGKISVILGLHVSIFVNKGILIDNSYEAFGSEVL